jgi:hypothetical protein
MKKIFMIILILTLTAVLSMSAFAVTESQDPQQALENSIISDTNTDLIVSASEAKDDTILKSDIKNLKGRFASQLEQLEGLKTEGKGLWSQIKASDQSIKAAMVSLKAKLESKNKTETKAAIVDLNTQIDPLKAHIKSIHVSIKTLRAQKAIEWKNFRAAIKANDEAKATIAMNNIIDLKTQIIYKQKEILPFKQILAVQIK